MQQQLYHHRSTPLHHHRPTLLHHHRPTSLHHQTVAFLSLKQLASMSVSSVFSVTHAKQCSLDTCPMWLLKDCMDIVMLYLTSLFNAFLVAGLFPDALKKQLRNTMVKEVRSGHLHYWTISNLSVLSKLLECAISNCMVDCFDRNNLLPKHQSAYRKDHSVKTALTKVMAQTFSLQ